MNSEPLNCEEYINKSKNKAGVISIITRDYYTPIKDLVDIFDVTNTKCRKFIINSNDKFCNLLRYAIIYLVNQNLTVGQIKLEKRNLF